jgi:gamma-glutamylcyclotransferase (GGCT)/AIG2-like uncharacterized protein YtfP
MKINHLFVYGTLQHPHVWRRVVTGEYHHAPGRLAGYKPSHIDGQVYPGLIEDEASFAEGMVYMDISDQDLERLDAFEGPSYRRIEVVIDVEDGTDLRCHTYLYVGDMSLINGMYWRYENYLLDGHDQFLSGYSGWDEVR